MTDIAYRCHHCGSTHEAESIRQNLYVDRRPVASYAAPASRRMVWLGEFFQRRRMTQGIAQALWPRYPHNSRRV